jgi:hypothetical protein
MNREEVDFRALAMKSLGELRVVIEGAGMSGGAHADDLAALTAPVIHLKANASTAGRSLVQALSNMMLGFLDEVDGVNDGVIEVVEGDGRVFSIIVERDIEGDGGEFGEQVQIELNLAHKRYFVKNPQD